MIKEIKDQDFHQEIREAKGTVLLLAYAPWCGDSQRILPIFRACSEEADCQEACFLQLDVDRNPETKKSLGIERYPTLCLFQDGRKVAKRVAEVPAAEQKSLIRELLR